METGDRRPRRETVLKLAEALGIDGEAVNEWLTAAGYAPMPLLTTVRAAVRTRGAIRRPSAEAVPPPGQDASLWARLEAMGLQEARIGRPLRAMETAKLTDRQEVAKAVSATFSRVADALEAPVHTAVIPAAGRQHRHHHVASATLERAIQRFTRRGPRRHHTRALCSVH